MDIGWALRALEQHGLSGIFWIVLLEYACFPLPSEALLPLAGLAAAASGVPLALVVAVSVVAGLSGSSVCYALGALGGRPLLDKLLKRFPKAAQSLDQTRGWQSAAGGLSVMVARVIPVFRTWVSFASGLARQPYVAFLLYSAMGIIVWNTLLLSGGYYLYLSGATLAGTQGIWLLPVCALVLTLAGFLIRRHQKRRRLAALRE